MRKAGALSPSAHVLDIGCGAGRLAVPLCAYLDEAGAYTGFDIARPGLRFARRVARGRCAIGFVHAELANAEYNRRGADPADYRFPAEAATIDLAVATSLFTHILPDVAQAYLREAGRVLKPQGRLMLTAFHVDAEARDALRSGRARQRLTPWCEAAWAADPRHPERAIGFDAEAFLTWAEAAGLRLAQPVIPGDWREPDRGADFQDWLVFEKA